MPTYLDFLRALGGHREKHLAVEKGIYESRRADAGGRGSDLGVKRISNQSAGTSRLNQSVVHAALITCCYILVSGLLAGMWALLLALSGRCVP